MVIQHNGSVEWGKLNMNAWTQQIMAQQDAGMVYENYKQSR